MKPKYKYSFGDYVKTKTWGHEGRIDELNPCFAATKGTGEGWFEGQEVAIPEEKKYIPWYSILCRNGGAVVVHEDDIDAVEPFELNNPYGDCFKD